MPRAQWGFFLMAGKKGARWTRGLASPSTLEELRRLIDAEHLIEALQNHGLGKLEMAPSQVTAISNLLRKILPDLSSTELTGDPVRPVTVQEVGSIVSRILPELAARDAPAEDQHPLTH